MNYDLPTAEIVDLYREGWGLTRIARRYGVSITPIYDRLIAAGVTRRAFEKYHYAAPPPLPPPPPPPPVFVAVPEAVEYITDEWCPRCDAALLADGEYTWCGKCAWEPGP